MKEMYLSIAKQVTGLDSSGLTAPCGPRLLFKIKSTYNLSLCLRPGKQGYVVSRTYPFWDIGRDEMWMRLQAHSIQRTSNLIQLSFEARPFFLKNM